MSVKIRFKVASITETKATCTAIPDPTIEDIQKSVAGDAVGALVVHFDTEEGKGLFKLGNEILIEISQAPKLKPVKPKD